MTSANSRCFHLVFLVAALGALGCGKDYGLAPVTGRVEIDHHPLANAEVSFLPLGNGKLPVSSGKTNEQGVYTLKVNDASHSEGAVIGQHRVTISIDVRSLDKRAAVTHMRKLEQLPSRYNRDSDLKFTVPPGGSTDANFLDLKSK